MSDPNTQQATSNKQQEYWNPKNETLPRADLERLQLLRQYGAIAIDMETSPLYTLAPGFGARALSICTVVDNMVTHDEIDPSERQEVFRSMIELALDVVATDHTRSVQK